LHDGHIAGGVRQSCAAGLSVDAAPWHNDHFADTALNRPLRLMD